VRGSAGVSAVRAEVLGLRPVVHGSVSAAELARYGVSVAEVLDFSVNTNPLGPAPSVLDALAQTDWSRYPGDDEQPLRRALAQFAGVSPEQVVLGNGSVELIWLIALASLRPGDPVAVTGATFGEYAHAAQVMGARVVELVDTAEARLVFVCNPNNPDGRYQSTEALRALAERCTGLLVIDEAYASFVDQRWDSAPLLEHGNVIVLRSLTKDHALPGLRLGYALAERSLAQAIEAVRPPWSVNAGALRAGLAALEPAAQAHLERARAVVHDARRMLSDGLATLGYPVVPSGANFVLVEVHDARAFRQALLRHGIVVRDCASFGLPGYVRIACKKPDECARLLAAVEELVCSPRC
jgi:L-threonine-O-3-phosphate decarboxylase